MKQFVNILLRLLSPGMGWVLLLTPFCAAALIFVLTSDRTAMPIAVVLYGLSAYTLAALIAGLPRYIADAKAFMKENKIISWAKRFFSENKFTNPYMTNIPVRVKASLYMALIINLTYAALKMTAAILYSSFWFGAEAVFYLVLGLVRFIILRNMHKGEGLKHGFQVYRFCGFLLFGLNAALTGIVYQMIHQGMGREYPGLLIYVVATYTFIFLITSVVQLVKYRKLNIPIISSVKIISFVQALVAIYSLQIAMFASFGEDERLTLVMNSIFGGLLCVSIFSMAVFMVVRGFEKLKTMQQ